MMETNTTKPKPKKVPSSVKRSSWNTAILINPAKPKHKPGPFRLYAYSQLTSYSMDEEGKIIPFNHTGVRSLMILMIEQLLAKLNLRQAVNIAGYVYTRHYLTERKTLNILQALESYDDLDVTEGNKLALEKLQTKQKLSINSSMRLMKKWSAIQEKQVAPENKPQFAGEPPADLSNGRERIPLFISTSWLEHPVLAERIQLWREMGLLTAIVMAFLDEIWAVENGLDVLLANPSAFIDGFVSKITAGA